MTKKKRRHPDVDEVLQRPWCYYCERDFDDLKILISHQKAKHFKCDRCGRRLNTAGGLAVHMNQVHKENLNQVENALPNRQGLDHEIFGMEGIPEDVSEAHRQRVIKQYYEDEANRRAATGNPPPGTVSGSKPKKARYESIEETKKRLADFRMKKASGQLGGEVKPPASASVVEGPGQSDSPAPFPQAASPPFAQPPFQAPPQASQPPSFHQPPPFQAPFEQQQPHFTGAPPPGFPGVPPAGFPGAIQGPPGMAGLPQRPPHMQGETASSVDDLISSVTNGTTAIAEPKEKKGKDKNTRLVYSDNDTSPEEKMARFSKYSFERKATDQPDVVMGEVGDAVTGIAAGPDDVVDKMN